MSETRLWIALAAVVSFLAGTAAGVLYGRAETAPPTSGWTAYGEWLGDEFDLAPERRSALRVLLGQYATELKNRRRAHEARSQAQLEPELRELATRYQGYIRDYVLPPTQRARYDLLSEPRDLVAAHP